MIPCDDMHQSFTDTFLKWFFDNFGPHVDDGFRLVSIHFVAHGLGEN